MMGAALPAGCFPPSGRNQGNGSRTAGALRSWTEFGEGRDRRALRKNGNESCSAPPESKWWRKDLRSIPKVFLIEACEVS
jgi:hypothetical protein